jgi:hypothetical protein
VALERFAKSVRGSLQARADLGQLPRREVDALLLRVRALAHRAELVCHFPDRLGQVGKLTGDQGGVLLLRHSQQILAGAKRLACASLTL